MIMIMMMIMKMMFSKEEMITMMKSCLVKQGTTEDDGDEGVKDLIEMTLRKMDHDKDGRVSYPDFQTTVTKAGILQGITRQTQGLYRKYLSCCFTHS